MESANVTATQSQSIITELRNWHLGAVIEADPWAEQEYVGDEQGMEHPRVPKQSEAADSFLRMASDVLILGGGMECLNFLNRGVISDATAQIMRDVLKRDKPVVTGTPIRGSVSSSFDMTESMRRAMIRTAQLPSDPKPKTRSSVKKKQKRKSQAAARRVSRK